MEIIQGSAGQGKTNALCYLAAIASASNPVTVFTVKNSEMYIINKISEIKLENKIDNEHGLYVAFIDNDIELIDKIKESNSTSIFIDGLLISGHQMEVLSDVEKETRKSILITVQTPKPINEESRAIHIGTYVPIKK